MFWRKVLDICATSIDYEPRIEVSHGQTAAELIVAAPAPMGLTHWLLAHEPWSMPIPGTTSFSGGTKTRSRHVG